VAEPTGGEPAATRPTLLDPRSLQPGQPLLRRYRRGPCISWLQACRIVGTDATGVLVWLPVGAGFAFRHRPDGRPVRAAPIADFASAELRTGGWQGRSALILMRAGLAQSVWWWFEGAVFSGWYVNLEDRSDFWLAGDVLGVDVQDHELDIVVAPDRSWQWKDEDDLTAVTGLAGYWDESKAALIRAEGLRAIDEVEGAEFPFDGSWCDFRPNPSWPVTPLPVPLPDFEWADFEWAEFEWADFEWPGALG